jgi:hypothetical protein
MPTVEMPMRVSVAMRTLLRPTLSPKWPAMMPPMGRATNPTPKVASASKVPTAGSSLWKNSVPKMVADSAP